MDLSDSLANLIAFDLYPILPFIHFVWTGIVTHRDLTYCFTYVFIHSLGHQTPMLNILRVFCSCFSSWFPSVKSTSSTGFVGLFMFSIFESFDFNEFSSFNFNVCAIVKTFVFCFTLVLVPSISGSERYWDVTNAKGSSSSSKLLFCLLAVESIC